ncbi:MAG: glycogen debranching N-terminal domain-containing protein [Synechococcus lacustris]
MPHDTLPPFVLKNGETFAMLDSRGEICQEVHPDSGIFYRGCRHVSRLQLLICGQHGAVLSSTQRGEIDLHVSHLTNASSGDGPAQGIIHIERSTALTPSSCLQQLKFTSYGGSKLSIPLMLIIDADFKDIFELRGFQRKARGQIVHQINSNGLRIMYGGLDGEARHTFLSLDAQAEAISETHISLQLELQPRITKNLCIALDFNKQNNEQSTGQQFANAINYSLDHSLAAKAFTAQIASDNPDFNNWLARSYSDIHLLSTPTTHGIYPYAGLPWFSCPFGRDGLITARQMLMVEPRLARGVLGYLAEHQAQLNNITNDAEPGKILHEARLGEMAALGEVPFANYYGSVDATPLFLMLAGDYLGRTDDINFITYILPSLELAHGWINRSLEISHDGFLRYNCNTKGGLRNQGWKDSEDAIHHSNGELVETSIALCEVQAYVFGAKRAMAQIYKNLKCHEKAEKCLGEAEAFKRYFHHSFWSDSLDSYVMALDAHSHPCAVRGSNAGHCLWTGIATAEAAASLSRQLLAPHSFSGWGIRTLDDREMRYNPMSYHNGSVWPHDNSLIGLGLARYGYRLETMGIMSGLFDTARAMPLYRLPELFCGFPRQEGEDPTHYPVACRPQAWASGSVFALVEAIIGLSMGSNSETGRIWVQLNNPLLPLGVNSLDISGLTYGDEQVDLHLSQGSEDVAVHVRHRTSRIDVQISK